MTAPLPGSPRFDWNRLRGYLRVLAGTALNDRLRSKLDPSDIVQQAMVRAVEAEASFRGSTDAELLAWLRQILANTLAEAVRHHTRQKRDADREQDILAALDASAVRGASLLVSTDARPEEAALRGERLLALCAALDALPPHQREAIELHYWRGLKVSEIAERMDRSAASVGGLLKRGLKALRESFAAD